MSGARKHVKDRATDLAIYIAISGAVIAFLVFGIAIGLSYGWIALWIATAFIFVSLIVVRRPLWSKLFWILVAVCLLLHLVVVMPRFAPLLDRTQQGRAGLLTTAAVLEYAFLLLLSKLFSAKHRRDKS